MHIFRHIACLLLPIVLTNCASYQLTSQSSQFNRATAHSNIERILLNAARASKRYPLQFTELAKYTSENMAKGSVAPEFPFGADAANLFNFKPTLNISSGVGSMEYGTLNNKDGLLKLSAPWSYEDFYSYLKTSSVSNRLLAITSIASVEIVKPLEMAIRNNYHLKCSIQQPNDQRCIYIRKTIRICGLEYVFPESAARFGSHEFFIHENSAASRCKFLGFQSFWLTLSLGKLVLDEKIVKKTSFGKTEEGKKVPVVSLAPEYAGFFGESSIQGVREIYKKILNKDGHSEIKVLFRSPKTMVEYVGELIRLQNYGNDKFTPVYLSLENIEIELAVIKSEAEFNGDAAVKIIDDEGQVFAIPRPDYGSPTEHETLRLLSIVSDALNSRIAREALPQTSTIILESR